MNCQRTLPLHAVQRVWPNHPQSEDHASESFEHVVAEARCDHCNYINYISLPTSIGQLFGLPDELAQTLIQSTCGRNREANVPYHIMCGQRARRWSLLHKIALISEHMREKKEAGYES